MSEVAENLKKLFEASGRKPAEIARELDTPPARISEILTGKIKNPRIDTLKRIVDALGGSMDFVLTGKGEMSGTHLNLVEPVPQFEATGGPGHSSTAEVDNNYVSVDIASKAMEALDGFLVRKEMNPSPKMKRKMYEGLIEEYIDREKTVPMDDILDEMVGGG